MLTESDIRAKSKALIEKARRLGFDDTGYIKCRGNCSVSVGFGGQYQVFLWVTYNDGRDEDGLLVAIHCVDEFNTLARAEHLIKGLR